MSLQINDNTPDFEVDATEGRLRFHNWIGDSWVVLLSHPKDWSARNPPNGVLRVVALVIWPTFWQKLAAP